MVLTNDEKAKIPAGKTVLELQLPQLMVDEKILSKNIKLCVKGQEKVRINGKNGCGKTTLLRMIEEEMSKEEMSKEEMSKEEMSKEEISKIRTYLGSMKYTVDEVRHKIEELSGGQKAKILLLKMSMSESNVLILDEPTRYFSSLSNPVIRTMLRNFKGVIITVSHDRKYIEEIADRVYELTDAGLVEVKWKNVDRVPVLFSELSPLNCTNCLKNLKKDVDTLEKPC